MRRNARLVAASLLASLFGVPACLNTPADEGKGGDLGSAAERGAQSVADTASAASDDIDLDEPSDEASPALATPRGFGTMTGRLPGTNTTVPGIRLRAHAVRVTIRDGFAHTEVAEEFANDDDRVLEGRYVFPMPPDASLSRLALWVGEELVEGEMVERDRAARIFQGIVDDTVRPRDPALLEWTRGSSFSLKIFPMPAHGSRKVLLAYDEVLPVVKGRARYVYPLSLGADRAVRMDSFQLHVTVEDEGATSAEAKVLGHPATLRTEQGRLEADFQADSFVPSGDFVLDYPRPQTETLPVAMEGDGSSERPGFFALRFPVTPETSVPPASRDERVLVIDTSHGITRNGLDAEVAVADAILRRLREDQRFAVLLCDSACVSYPERGLASPTPEALGEAGRLLHAAVPRGASDVAGAIVEAAGRLDEIGRGQVVYLGDGAASAGELGVSAMAARIRPILSDKRAELRLFGAGPSIDEMALEGLAESLSASYERLATGESLKRRAADVAKNLSTPLLSVRTLALPVGFVDVYPKTLPAVRLGEEIVLVGRVAGATGGQDQTVKISGTIDGEPVEISRPLSFRTKADSDRTVLSRRWATARIGELGRDSSEAAAKEIVALSQKHHVQSRLTSLLVLENDRMFAAFGIPRTQASGKLSAEAETAGTVGTRGLSGDSVGDSFGVGGLGLSGVGEGGGGTGSGMGTAVGHMFGSGHGRLSGEHKSSGPSVRMGATSVSGRIPPEVIQRIVRQNFGRFRLCYENGLRSNPELRGRVAVRFIITRDGAVGSVGNGGSDLPDAGVVNCVIRGFQGLRFPEPEGGIVTVNYPIVFSPEGGSSASIRWRPTSTGFSTDSWIGKADDAWRKDGGDAIARFMKDLEASPESRRARETVITGLLSRGRFDEALREATQYVTLDPDRVRAHELVAQAAAALGDEEAALSSLESEIEIDPKNAEAHRRAARAFEASGDERRACAHFRALSELRPHDEDALFESLRCKARVFHERDASLAQAAALKDKSKKIAKLYEALEKGELPAYSFAEPGGDRISVKVDCGAGVEGCPRVVLLDPQGRVTTPILPGNGRSGASWVSSWASSGNYRVLVTGGLPNARGEVTVRLDETTRKFEVHGGPGARTVALVTIGL